MDVSSILPPKETIDKAAHGDWILYIHQKPTSNRLHDFRRERTFTDKCHFSLYDNRWAGSYGSCRRKFKERNDNFILQHKEEPSRSCETKIIRSISERDGWSCHKRNAEDRFKSSIIGSCEGHIRRRIWERVHWDKRHRRSERKCWSGKLLSESKQERVREARIDLQVWRMGNDWLEDYA